MIWEACPGGPWGVLPVWLPCHRSQTCLFGIGSWFLVCNATTQLALELQQERIQVVRSNKVVRRLPTESNGTPAMELGFEDTRICRYTNKTGTEQNTHP